VTDHSAHAAHGDEQLAAHDDHHNDPASIAKELKVYWLVFGGLAVLTGITVGLCYGFDLPVHTAIFVALVVALIKGFLVAGFFMHLLNEKKLIYSILGITVFFFAVLLWGPWHHVYDLMK
jgi:cytochrome c oxidase subunit 4